MRFVQYLRPSYELISAVSGGLPSDFRDAGQDTAWYAGMAPALGTLTSLVAKDLTTVQGTEAVSQEVALDAVEKELDSLGVSYEGRENVVALAEDMARMAAGEAPVTRAGNAAIVLLALELAKLIIDYLRNRRDQ